MNEPDRNTIILLAIAVEGGLAVAAIVLGWLFGHSPLRRFHLDGRAALAGMLAATPMLAAFLVMVRWPVGPLRGVKAFTDAVVRPLLGACTLLDLFGISVLAGVGEEVLFRGLMQDLFAGWLPLWLAVALASGLFGLLHAVTPTYAVLAAVMGAYMGGVYLWTGNLLVPIVTHAVYDFVVLAHLMYGPESRGPAAHPEEEKEDATP